MFSPVILRFVSRFLQNAVIVLAVVMMGAVVVNASRQPTTCASANGLIAFVGRVEGNSEIFTVNGDGSGERRLTSYDDSQNSLYAAWSPVWSPDGSQIAFDGMANEGKAIYTIDADGSHLLNLTGNAANDYHPVWSPVRTSSAGQQILFISNRDGGHDSLHVMNTSDSDPHRLGNPSIDAAWSPDGQQIAFTYDTVQTYAIFL